MLVFGLFAEGLTEVGLDSPGLKGEKGGKVAVVEVSGGVEEEEGVEADLSFLLRSWMLSWMPTMLKYVLVMPKRSDFFKSLLNHLFQAASACN